MSKPSDVEYVVVKTIGELEKEFGRRDSIECFSCVTSIEEIENMLNNNEAETVISVLQQQIKDELYADPGFCLEIEHCGCDNIEKIKYILGG